jgi:hypothetical protein
MLTDVPAAADWTSEIARIAQSTGADAPADRLERAVEDQVTLLALIIDERAIILNALDDPPEPLAQLRAVLMNEHRWREAHGR